MPPGQVIEGEPPLVGEVSTRHRLERGLQISLFVALCSVLVFGPLALGIVQDWSIALFESGSAVVLLIWLLWQIAAREVSIRWNPLFAPMLVFFGFVSVQIVSHRSAYSYDTLTELWLCIAYGILAFIAVQLFCAENGWILRFGKTMAVFGSIYAVFAILQGFTS